MAQLEAAKHGRNVIEIAARKESRLAHKLREIALQVVIIVFAVSISIWFHSLSERRHEQQQVKAFLLGLKTDLTRDVMNLNDFTQSYRSFDSNFKYLAELDPKGAPDGDKFENAYDLLRMSALFIPINSRFEGFKSSGKLVNIEDEELLNDILTLYELNHKQLGLSEGGWKGNLTRLRDYLDVVLQQGDSAQQRYQALTSPNGKRLLRNLVAPRQVYQRYASTVELSTRIIKRINVLYSES